MIKHLRSLDYKPLLKIFGISVAFTALLETIARRSFVAFVIFMFTGFVPFIYNCIIVCITLYAAAFFKRQRGVLTLLCAVWLTLVTISAILHTMRPSPLTAADFGIFFSCVEIMDSYLSHFEIVLSVLAAVAIIAAVISVFSKKEKSFSFPYIKPEKSNSVCVVESIISAAESCFRMCAFIIIACGILEIVFEGAFFGYAEKNPLLKSLVSGFFEVTAGVISCRDITGYCSVIAAGAIASFSGISVIFQIAAVTDESKIPLFPFILSRFFHSGITALILKIFLLFSGKSIAVLSFNGGKTEAVLSASAPAAVSLLCMAALFLLSVVPPKSEKEPLLSRIWHKFEKFWHSQTR